MLENYPAGDATHHQKQTLYNNILNCVANVKGKISNKNFYVFQRVMKDFLRDNVIFHPDLTQYIDETETYTSKPSSPDPGARAFVDIKDVTTAEELAEKLYFMSDRSRASAYAKIADKLLLLATDSNKLGNILRFLPADIFEDALKKRINPAIIGSVGDIHLIMEKLFTALQRKQVFHALKHRINDMAPTFEQLGGLMQYLDKAENTTLISAISFDKVKAESSAELLGLFDKLSTEQINHVLPLLEKKMAAYLTSHAIPDGGHALYTFLKSKTTEAGALKSLKSIFPGLEDAMSSVPAYKERLSDIVVHGSSSTEPEPDDGDKHLP